MTRHVEVVVTPAWAEPVSAAGMACHSRFRVDTSELALLCDGPLSHQAQQVRQRREGRRSARSDGFKFERGHARASGRRPCPCQPLPDRLTALAF